MADRNAPNHPTPTERAERSSRTPRTPRRAWLHLATSSVSSVGLPSPSPAAAFYLHDGRLPQLQQYPAHAQLQQRKRPQPLKTFVLGLESRESNGGTPTTDPPADGGGDLTPPCGGGGAGAGGEDTAKASARSAASDATADTRFPFISPVEPVLTLARFHRSLNKVYIPLDDEEELEVVRTYKHAYIRMWCWHRGKSIIELQKETLTNKDNTHSPNTDTDTDTHRRRRQCEAGFRALNGAGSNFALLGTPGSSLLGGGAFGQVYKAIHFPTMRRVAIKKIPKDFGRTHEYANSFARELRNLYHNLQQLSARVTPKALGAGAGGLGADTVRDGSGHCPYLLTLYDAYVERNPTNLCLVLEYMEGGSLEQVVAAGAGGGGCDDEGFLREVSHNVLKVRFFVGPQWFGGPRQRISTDLNPSPHHPTTAQGLHHLHHRGYLHQDVKPGNVLLTADRFAKLADFGLTVAVSGPDAEEGEGQEVAAGGIVGQGASLYGDAVVVGTARYWPPELWGAESTFCVACLLALGD